MENRKFADLSKSEKFLLPLNLISAGIDLAFSIPLVGRLGKWVWNSFLTLLHFLFGLIELLFWMAGFRPTKKLRIGFLVCTGEDGEALAHPEDISPAIKYAERAFEGARIGLVPAFPPPKRLSESEEEDEGRKWMRVLSAEDSIQIINANCDLQAVLQDLGLHGSRFQYNTVRALFHSTLRRVSGYGAPIAIFVIKDLNGFGGCSLAWLSDYITVLARSLKTTAHEIGHACNLLHRKDPENLMNPSSVHQDSVTLTIWQIAMLRASRHVTLI
ncbi:MAG: hypothetical protein JW757_13620 [Anaerolineales bacterium]|nr:hypothetical protein [Anaerolineales bacterium]